MNHPISIVTPRTSIFGYGTMVVSVPLRLLLLQLLLLYLSDHYAIVAAAASYGSEGVISITGSGAAAPCLEFIMEILQVRAQVPTRLTYREINNRTEGQMEFLQSARTGSIDFGAGHRPLPSWIYQSLQQKDGIDVLHFPYVLSPVALYHNIPGVTQLNLTSCMIAQIFKRNIKSWKNHVILEQNPFMEDMSPNAIVPLHPSSLSEITLAFTEVG
jgi:ABC-type phosphate transport system substrate-binding protein